MKNYYLLFCMLIAITTQAQSVAERARTLNTYYNTDTKQFFHAFPDNYTDFVALYGYSEAPDTLAILYSDALKHVDEFFATRTEVDDAVFFNKLIDLSIKGHWQADGVSYLQDGLRKCFLENENAMKDLLSKRTTDEQYAFWCFYFDGPHPDKAKPPIEYYKQFGAMYNTIKQAHQATLKDNEH